MSARGACGFRIDGIDKIAYNHFDSYPDGLGEAVIEAVAGITDWHAAAVNVRAISVIEDPEDTWYERLRSVQGKLAPYLNGDIGVMVDASAFLLDSLFCEWAYIVNFDTQCVEIYKGFNTTGEGKGRYAKTEDTNSSWRTSRYYGVMLVTELPFQRIQHPSFDLDAFIQLVVKLTNEDEDDE